MGPARGSQGRREYGFSPDRPSAVFCLGRMGHWNGDRDCEPTRLTVVARMGETGGETPPRPERRNPAMGRPWRGLVLDHPKAAVAKSWGGGGNGVLGPKLIVSFVFCPFL